MPRHTASEAALDERPVMDIRLVLCPTCGSEGRMLTCDGGPDEIDHGGCPYCDGTGREIIQVLPLELDDEFFQR